MVRAGLVVVLAAAGCGDDDVDGADALPNRDGPTTVTVELADAVTDNYKACFNAEPEAYEERTWLSVVAVELDEVPYTPVDVPADGETVFVPAADGLPLGGPEGGSAVLRIEAGPSSTARTQGSFRISGDRFGYLATVVSPDALADDPLAVTVTVEREDGAVGTVDIEYVFDDDIAAAPPGTPEHNGPSGRWLVDGRETTTDLERSPYGC